MKKALLIIVAIVACCALLANADYLMEFANTIATGAVVPIVIACIVMLLRHLTQAMSYKTAFDAVDFKETTLWQNIVLIFSLVFINTFCLFSGATGVAFIIEAPSCRRSVISRPCSSSASSASSPWPFPGR